MGALIDKLPVAVIAVLAVLMLLVPFGQSHFVEKLNLLMAGQLTKPIDIFDLLFHSAPSLVLAAKLWRMALKPKA